MLVPDLLLKVRLQIKSNSMKAPTPIKKVQEDQQAIPLSILFFASIYRLEYLKKGKRFYHPESNNERENNDVRTNVKLFCSYQRHNSSFQPHHTAYHHINEYE